MTPRSKLNELKLFAETELVNNILPFWRKETLDRENQGFYGEISNDLSPNKLAPKGLILNARILWTFSAAYQYTKNEKDRKIADTAFNYISNYFYDAEYKGYYWTVTHDGKPYETKKQIYALAFTIYGMSEYYKITKNLYALNRSIELFHLIEKKSFDKKLNGYFEAFERDWNEIDDLRLSEKDMNEKKTMNTHLHIIEAYCNLYSIWEDQFLADRIRNLIYLFTDKIISKKDYHLNLFFNDEWESKSATISYGHDIEAGWLIHESALILGTKKIIKNVETIVPKITDASLQGISELGGLYYEGDRKTSHIDNEFEWWPQAEAIVGLLNTFQLTNIITYVDYAVSISEFIKNYIVDSEKGEWFYRVDKSGKTINTYPKVGLWKCPYHNTRSCLEIIKRVDALT